MRPKAETHRAGMGVGLGAEFKLAAAEHLGVQRGELGMNLEADDGLPVFQNLFESLHSLFTCLKRRGNGSHAVRSFQSGEPHGTC